MVAAHPAGPHAAKAHAAGGQVDDGVVDAASAEGGPAEEPLLGTLFLRKQIQGQGPGPGVDEVQRLPDLIEGKDGEHRPENFLLHHRVLRGHVVQHSGLDFQRLRVAPPAEDHLGRVDKPHHPVEVLPIDHADITVVVQGVLAVHHGDPPLNIGQERSLYPPVDEQVVGGHAGLAAVKQLAEHQPFGGQVQPGGAVHNTGALAPQLQGDGGEVPGRPGHHLFAHLHPAGEEDIVEFLVQQSLILRPSALHHRDKLRRKALRQNPPEDRRGGRGVGRGLHHAAVAGGNGPDQGLDGEQKGVIPGRHNEHHPVGCRNGEAPGGELGQGGEVGPVGHPAPQPLLHKRQLRQGEAHLAHVALGGGLVQVGAQGGGNVPLVGRDGLPQALEGCPAGGQGEGGSSIEIGPLGRHKGLNVHRLPPEAPSKRELSPPKAVTEGVFRRTSPVTAPPCHPPLKRGAFFQHTIKWSIRQKFILTSFVAASIIILIVLYFYH